jgi:hypothetical protein
MLPVASAAPTNHPNTVYLTLKQGDFFKLDLPEQIEQIDCCHKYHFWEFEYDKDYFYKVPDNLTSFKALKPGNSTIVAEYYETYGYGKKLVDRIEYIVTII